MPYRVKIETDRLKTGFISTISHELRTPLATIKSGVELVLDGIAGGINKKQAHFLNISMRNIDRLTGLIEDLLDISRIESGKMVINRKRVSVASTVRKSILSLGPNLNKKRMRVKQKIPKRLPDIFVDEDKIIQVIANLVSNAARYSQTGSTIEIEAGPYKREGFIEVSVADHGVGIAAEDIPKLFQEFSQINRMPGPGAKGTGLGLAICRGFLAMHGCNIWVKRSAPKRGTIIAFTLPVYIKGQLQ